jgi:hypothetical protein
MGWRKERGRTHDAMSGDCSVIADTLKSVVAVCRSGYDSEQKMGVVVGERDRNECDC